MKRPWNIPNLPVYSLASRQADITNMNICVYVSAVSMKPKRYAVAVYHKTKTLENIKASGFFVLQLLASDQYLLVNPLGKKSGTSYAKETYLRKKNLLCDWRNWKVLEKAVAWMEMKVLSVQDAGDHDLFLCDVTAYKVQNEKKVLTLDDLRKRKLVRM